MDDFFERVDKIISILNTKYMDEVSTDIPEDDSFRPVEKKIIGEELKDQIRGALENNYLSDREKDVLRLRYGFTQGRPLTLDEIGEYFGISGEAIRLIEAKALRKTRHPSKTRNIREHTEPD